MTPWLTFLIGGLLLTLVIIGGLLLPRRKQPAPKAPKLAEDSRVLYVLLWLASLSIMAYIVFAFGKR